MEKGKRRMLRLREKQLVKTAEGSTNLFNMAENPINGEMSLWGGGKGAFPMVWICSATFGRNKCRCLSCLPSMPELVNLKEVKLKKDYLWLQKL